MPKKHIILACSVCGARNYTVKSNPQTRSKRLEVKKFCKHCKAHTLHQQTK